MTSALDMGIAKGKELLNGKEPEQLTDEEYEIFADALIDYFDLIKASDDVRDEVAWALNDVPR